MDETIAAPRKTTKGTLSRGLQILRVLRRASYPLSLGKISETCDLDTGTAHRLIHLMIEQGFILKHPSDKLYIVSPNEYSPIGLYHPLSLLRRDAQPTLATLRDHTGETAGLILYVFRERLVFDIAEGKQAWHPYYDVWLKTPLHASVSGKLALLTLDVKEKERLLGSGPYEAHTPATITDPEDLARDLDVARSRGYAAVLDEANMGRSAVAAPITNRNGDLLGCFVIAGSTSNFGGGKMEEFGERVFNAGDLFSGSSPSLGAVSSVLGFQP